MEKIEYIDIKSIRPYERNAKKHPEEQIQYIANSLQRFGWKQPIVVDKNNVIIVGHGRLLAAKKLGMDKVPVVCADDLTATEVQAYRLADNKVAESDWDYDLLDLELDELDELEDIDMRDFGFELSDGGVKSQNIDPGGEVDISDYSDDKFEVKCPRCGFMFNSKEAVDV